MMMLQDDDDSAVDVAVDVAVAVDIDAVAQKYTIDWRKMKDYGEATKWLES